MLLLAVLTHFSTVVLAPKSFDTSDPTMRSIRQVAEGYVEVTRAEARTRASFALRGLGLGGADEFSPFMLSGGMAQRVALAATGAGGASVVIVDEPTKGLDADLRDGAVSVLRGVVTSGRTLLTITHDVSVARALGGTVAVMLDGVFVEQGPAEVMRVAPRHEYTRRLLAAEPSAWPARPTPRTGEPIVWASGLTKRYAPERCSRILMWRCALDSGWRSSAAAARGKLRSGTCWSGSCAPMQARFDGSRRFRPSGSKNSIRTRRPRFHPESHCWRRWDDLGARHRLDPSEVERLMNRLRLDPVLLERHPHQVSGGELQRFALLRVLLLSPAFIFADEPTSRLDPIT